MNWYTFDCGCRFPMEGDSIALDIENVPLNCPRVWDMLGEGLTKGVFQLESNLGRHWCKKLKPRSIEHLCALGSILRPGCLRNIDKDGVSTTEHYCLRKNLEEDVTYEHPSLEPILNTTYGVMCYQEQAMEIAKVIAGFNLQQADELRKAIGKKLAEEMHKVEIKFLAGVEQAKIVSIEQGKQIFAGIKESQRYSFNKSHSLCYAINGYRSAYCKAHFPLQFLTSYLYYANEKQDPKKEVRELINEAKLMDIDVLPPDIISLEPNFFTDKKVVYFGLTNIKGIGDSVVRKINNAVKEEEKRSGKPCKDWSWFQLLARIGPVQQVSNRIGKSVMAALISAGALRKFGNNRTLMLAELDAWDNLSKGEALFLAERADKYSSLLEGLKAVAPLKKDGGGCHGEKRQQVVQSVISLLENPPTKMEDSPNWIAGTEEMLLGISITCSRVDGCDLSAINCSCRDFLANANRKGSIILGVEIENVQECKTKKGKKPGQKMARLSVSDGTCAIEAVCFPDAYKEYSDLLSKGNTVILQGERDRNQGSFIIKHVYQAELMNDD